MGVGSLAQTGGPNEKAAEGGALPPSCLRLARTPPRERDAQKDCTKLTICPGKFVADGWTPCCDKFSFSIMPLCLCPLRNLALLGQALTRRHHSPEESP